MGLERVGAEGGGGEGFQVVVSVCRRGRRAGRREGWAGRVSGGYVVLGKFQQDWWRLLEPRLPNRRVLCLAGMDLPQYPSRLRPQLGQLVGSVASGQTWCQSHSAAAGTRSPSVTPPGAGDPDGTSGVRLSQGTERVHCQAEVRDRERLQARWGGELPSSLRRRGGPAQGDPKGPQDFFEISAVLAHLVATCE